MTENGGIKKGNSSSTDNTLAYPQFNVHSGQWAPNPPTQRGNNQETNLIVEYNQIMNNNFNSDSKASFKKDVQIKEDNFAQNNQIENSFNSQNNYNPNFHSATNNRPGNFTNNFPGSLSASNSNIDIRNSIDFFTKQAYKQVSLKFIKIRFIFSLKHFIFRILTNKWKKSLIKTLMKE